MTHDICDCLDPIDSIDGICLRCMRPIPQPVIHRLRHVGYYEQCPKRSCRIMRQARQMHEQQKAAE